MSDSLNNKELVAVGHELAKALNSDTPIIDIAKILSRLAERLDATTAILRETEKQRDVLAAENSTIKTYEPEPFGLRMMFVLDKFESGGEDVPELAMLNAYRDIRALVETPATSAFLAEVRASAITDALKSLDGVFDTDCVMESNGISYEDAEQRTAGAYAVSKAIEEFAANLRKGVQS